MSSTVHQVSRAAAIVAILTLASQALAQSDDADPEMRVQQLENQLRQLTGQNEELQYRNRQLEERLRALQGGAQVAPGAQPAMAQPGMVQPGIVQPSMAAPPTQPGPSYRQPAYEPPQIAAPAPIMQEAPVTPQASGRRRGDAFDPSQNPTAPGAPRALGGGQLPIPAEGPVGAPGGRAAGEPLDLANTATAGNPAAMPSTPARIRTRRACLGRWAAGRCRLRTMRR